MANVLIIGSGGREHALSYRFNQSKFVEHVFCIPGNVGIEEVATCVNIDLEDFDAITLFSLENIIDLVVVGPEVPLMQGIVDHLTKAGLKVFGPTKKAAQLESSKVFAKEFMIRNKIPTANFSTFTDYQKARDYIDTQDFPVVVKASGLAQGKGVVIALNKEEAIIALDHMMNDKVFGSSGDEVIIEEFMEGVEFSLLALCHKESYALMPAVQDHKRAYDNDKGPNTGGMGVFMPVSFVDESVIQDSINLIIEPTLNAMIKEENPFTGVLFCGIMVTTKGLKVIEYNTRFGDPETEILMMALESDLYEVILDILDNKNYPIKFSNDAFVGVVLASNGYPKNHLVGNEVPSLENINSNVFHMGTKRVDHKVVNAGGRVLIYCNHGETIEAARMKVYDDLKDVNDQFFFYRNDIGK